MNQQYRIGFLGTGKMGAAIVRGLAADDPDLDILAFDPHPNSELIQSVPGLTYADSGLALEESCDVIVLCVKPQDMVTALKGFSGQRRYISIAAGVSTDRIRGFLTAGQNTQISRVMPNISATVGHAVSGIYCVDDTFFGTVQGIFEKVGIVVRVATEDLLHAVTGLAGSGPAFVFSFVQALAEGGVAAGLTYEAARRMACDTIVGSIALLNASDEHPDVWRNRVTSPAGTTIAGLQVLEENGFHGAVMGAVQSAARRSRELGG
ncbi:MAG: pyrroline-5-carboxylate reductase [Leptospiraceae bacterium]|nr:pyrroline-5-carboxylate reductase [Leptospiraceae bacterium]